MMKDQGPQGDERIIDFNQGQFSICLTREAFVCLIDNMQRFEAAEDDKPLMIALDMIDLPDDEDDFDA